MSRAATLIAVWLALAAGGCAARAVRPPTPAARLTGAELDQMPRGPDDRYYFLVFGSESVPKRPKYTHSWATMVRAAGGRVAEVHTISWLPAKVDIDPLSRTVEPGANFTLDDTLRNAVNTNQKIVLWGPFEVGPRFYHRFLAQKQFLEGGTVGYQCIDSMGEARTGAGCDCIHAVTDMDPVYSRVRYPLAYYGQAASANLVRRVMQSPVVVDPPRTHDWVLSSLGLEGYPIDRREYRGPTMAYEPGTAGDLTQAPRIPLPLPIPLPVPLPPPAADTPAPPPASPPGATPSNGTPTGPAAPAPKVATPKLP